MGQEIETPRFAPEDFAAFALRVAEETDSFERLESADGLAHDAYVGGFELEAWLVDRNYFPLAKNAAFLERVASPLVVPELSRFNVELNGTPQVLGPGALERLERELEATWRHCVRTAHSLGGTLVMIGILPTVREQDLSLANISRLNRFHALNEQILKARGGRPIRLDIRGRERLALAHADVMLEAATTSFQVHLQTPAAEFARHFNASVALSAPMVAVAANSPFLFGASLWDETRIPLFEQAADTGAAESGLRRVTFGSGYLERGATECFRENLEQFPALLPMRCDGAQFLPHLRLHNGTIWRWNRPLVGLEEGGRPHVRIEHRVMPAGPTIIDMIANAALYLGAAHFLARHGAAPESALAFEVARENFYAAARDGLAAEIVWLDGRRVRLRSLLADELVPIAHEGLRELGFGADERDRYLDLIAARVRTGQTGAVWQRAHLERHGRDFFSLTADYLEHQRSGMPVHEWDV
jgi:hypothetical protein